jgi:hypothetical protein
MTNKLTDFSNTYANKLLKCLDSSLFELPDEEQLCNSLNVYLHNLSEKNTIKDSSVKCRQATWEDFYPSMPERLLAIEAVEKFGAVFHDTLPEECKGYPYHKIIWWSIQGKDYNKYWGNSEDGHPPYESDLKEGESIIESITYEIKNPANMMLVDIYIIPIKPIEYIKIAIQE